MNHEKKLALLRQKMRLEGVDALLLSMNDVNLTESPNFYWRSILWLSGFSGSSGLVIVTADALALWTDSRYTVQAKREVDIPECEFHDLGSNDDVGIAQWLAHWSVRNKCVGFTMGLDTRTWSAAEFEDLLSKCKEACGEGFGLAKDVDLISDIWDDRPALPSNKVFSLDISDCGVGRVDKLRTIRGIMGSKGVSHYLVASADGVAWLTNLRSPNYPIHPLFSSFLLISSEQAELFADLSLFSSELIARLEADGYRVFPEAELDKRLSGIPGDADLLYDPSRVNAHLSSAVPKEIAVICETDIISDCKKIKNPTEIAGLRCCNEYECACLVRVIKYLKENIGGISVNEYEIGQLFEAQRQLNDRYLMPGNIPIVAYMANAALPHYRPNSIQALHVSPEGLLLFDLVAHYYCGTTDITRTIALGAVSGEVAHDYTMVLKALIAASSQRFAYGCTGVAIDAVARAVMWNERLDYGHGTGHGIGCCLTVHESPPALGPIRDHNKKTVAAMKLEPGMVTSCEPGLYREGSHGIRLENDLLITDDQENYFGRFLRFETLTYCPFDRCLVDTGALTEAEIDWVNEYHRQCFQKLSPYLSAEERQWLADQTSPLVC